MRPLHDEKRFVTTQAVSQASSQGSAPVTPGSAERSGGTPSSGGKGSGKGSSAGASSAGKVEDGMQHGWMQDFMPLHQDASSGNTPRSGGRFLAGLGKLN